MDTSNQFIVIIVTLPILGGALFWYAGILAKRFPEFHLDFFAVSGEFLGLSIYFSFFLFLPNLALSLCMVFLVNFLFGWCLAGGILPFLLFFSEEIYNATPSLPNTPLTNMGSKIGFLKRFPQSLLAFIALMWSIGIFHSMLPPQHQLTFKVGIRGRYWQYAFFLGLAINFLAITLIGLSPILSTIKDIWQIPFLILGLALLLSGATTLGALFGEIFSKVKGKGVKEYTNHRGAFLNKSINTQPGGPADAGTTGSRR